MSSEEMVAAIQNGDTGLQERLWERVCKLVRVYAYRYYMATNGRGGVTIEDLEQTGYLAMVEAADRYDPGKAAFSTYLVQYLHKYFQEASGRLYQTTNGQLMPKDALDVSISLNMPLDDDEKAELMEIIADPTAILDNVEAKICNEQLQKAVEDALRELPEDQTSVMHCRFWENLTYEETAVRLGRGTGSVRAMEEKAIRTLRKPKSRERLMPFYDFSYYNNTGLGAYKSTGESVQERYLLQKERFKR